MGQHSSWKIMQPIKAFSIAPDARDWLSNSRCPRILHIFDHTCNLINESREVLSIVTPQIGNGPFNLVIPRLRKSLVRLPGGDASRETSEVFSKINLNSPLSVSGNQLTLGDLTITTTNAKLWSPRPDWERLYASRENILKQLIPLLIINSQPLLPNSLVSNLSSALATTDISTALSVTRKLAGLGNGLTPAGDDFILGAMLATWIIHPPKVARVLAEDLANTAAPLTTSLSAAWLRSAGRGEAGILWHQFFDALVSANVVQIEDALDKILAVGATSGADALAGFIGTIRYRAEL